MKFLKWIVSLFNKSETPTSSKPIEQKPVETKPLPSLGVGIKKIAVIVGHGNGDSGAMGWNGMSEFNYNSFVAEMIEQSDTGKEIRVFYRGSSGIVGVAAKAIAWNPDMTLELHLNAYNGKAFGCEVLCLKSDSKSAEIGRSFAANFTTAFNRKMRGEFGIKWIGSSDRGYTSLKAVSSAKYSILVEPFFIDSKDEWIEPSNYADFLIKWIKQL